MNRAGSFLYEPAGSVHTLQCIEDDTHVWFQMYGANLNLDADGNIESVVDGARHARGLLHALRGRRAAPAERPRRLTRDEHQRTGVDLGDPDTFVDGAPHERTGRAAADRPGALAADGRRARVLGGAAPRRRRARVAREPELFSASEGGVVLENLAPEQTRDDAQHAAGDGPAPSTSCTARPLSPHFQARVIGRTRGPHPRDLPSRSWPRRGSRREVEFVHEVASRAAVAGDRRADGLLPEEDWDLIHVLAERNTLGQDPDRRRRTKAMTSPRTIDMAMYAIEFAASRRARRRGRGPHHAHPRRRLRRSSR